MKEELTGYVDTDEISKDNLLEIIKTQNKLISKYLGELDDLRKCNNDLLNAIRKRDNRLVSLESDNKILMEENDRMNKILYKIDELLYNYNECDDIDF